MYSNRAFSRRDFLKGTGKAALLGGLAGLGFLNARPAAAATLQVPAGIDPLVWVWKFSADGPLPQIRDTLSANGLGIIFKTHDGTSWMAEYDDSPDAVTGPAQVAHLASVFEQAGVGFHAWCVVQGIDPVREAQMCADVLNAGARDIYLDLEPKSGNLYWQGTAVDALRFGEELRRLVPNAWVVVAPDSRPWQAGHVPMAEFMSFSNAVAPQAYWETFQGPSNIRQFAQHGYAVGPEGVTPELVIQASAGTFQGFGKPIYPIGQGDSSPDRWQRFIDTAVAHGMHSVSLWRYGVSDFAAFTVLASNKAQPLPPVAEAPPAPVEVPAQAVAQPAAVQEAPPAEQPAAEQPAAAQPPEGLQEETFAVQQAPAAQAETAPVQPRSDLPDTELLQLQANGQIGRLSGEAEILDRGHAAVFRYRTSTIKERISSGLVEHFLDLLR